MPPPVGVWFLGKDRMFSAQVRAYRQRQGMTQEELAARTGVSVRSIRNLEAGRVRHPRPGTVRLLADAFALHGADRDRFCRSALDDTGQGHAGGSPGGAVDTGPARGRPAPAQLPADVAGFVGRTDHLRHLTKLRDDGDRPAAVVISAIAGTAGVGKTALAVHWAHQALDRFPDGQLYANLRGYDPEQPTTPGEVLARFLTALGVPGPEVPADPDERAARYRTEIAGRRMLIVLDNAATVEQVRPLLPGTGSCMVLVTSRDSLAGLVAVHGAHRLDLDLLPPADAVTLLRRLIGYRVDADPDAATRLATQCAHLPLALRVAAELAVARPTTPLAELVTELTDQQSRLDLLDADGDPRASVAAVFSWSIRNLPPDAARTFRLLGLHPGPDLDAHAAAALAGTGLSPARRALDRLARAHLVHPTGPGRYGLHDLLGAYATSLTTAQDSDTDRRAASTRLFDYYLTTAAAAAERLHMVGAHDRPDLPAPTTPTPDLADPEAARRWLDTERPCLAMAAAHTAAHGWPGHTVRLSMILYRYLEGSSYTDALTIHGHARDAARQAGDLAGEGRALLGLAATNFRLGRVDPAVDQFDRALALFRRAGDRVGEARVLTNLGVIEENRGRYQAAADRYEQALALYRQSGYRDGEAHVLAGLAIVEERLGRYQTAIAYYEQAMPVYRQVGNRTGEGQVLNNLGVVEERLGRYRSSHDHHEQALALFRQAGYPAGVANALVNLGLVEERLGRHRTATDHHEQALALFRQLGQPRGEAWALYGLGSVHTRLGHPDQAIALHQQALALFRQSGDRYGEARALNGLGEAALAAGHPADAVAHHSTALTDTSLDQQARAHAGLGHAHRALGDLARARHHYERALTLHTDRGFHDADDVRTHLTALDGTPGAAHHPHDR
ncbi:ATP-binding protein [Planosporangium sp. 12N6]|uniref:ATP-binding protein n=1 Tax=Planosporangium spinosum TaxID=3402278 RepID=UPI003CF4A8B2